MLIVMFSLRSVEMIFCLEMVLSSLVFRLLPSGAEKPFPSSSLPNLPSLLSSSSTVAGMIPYCFPPNTSFIIGRGGKIHFFHLSKIKKSF